MENYTNAYQAEEEELMEFMEDVLKQEHSSNIVFDRALVYVFPANSHCELRDCPGRFF